MTTKVKKIRLTKSMLEEMKPIDYIKYSPDALINIKDYKTGKVSDDEIKFLDKTMIDAINIDYNQNEYNKISDVVLKDWKPQIEFKLTDIDENNFTFTVILKSDNFDKNGKPEKDIKSVEYLFSKNSNDVLSVDLGLRRYKEMLDRFENTIMPSYRKLVNAKSGNIFAYMKNKKLIKNFPNTISDPIIKRHFLIYSKKPQLTSDIDKYIDKYFNENLYGYTLTELLNNINEIKINNLNKAKEMGLVKNNSEDETILDNIKNTNELQM